MKTGSPQSLPETLEIQAFPRCWQKVGFLSPTGDNQGEVCYI